MQIILSILVSIVISHAYGGEPVKEPTSLTFKKPWANARPEQVLSSNHSLVIAYEKDGMYLNDTKTGKSIWKIGEDTKETNPSGFTSNFSSDGRLLAMGNCENFVNLYDTKKRTQKKIKLKSNLVFRDGKFHFSPNGRYLAFEAAGGCSNYPFLTSNVFLVIDTESGKQRIVPRDGYYIESLNYFSTQVFSPDSRYLMLPYNYCHWVKPPCYPLAFHRMYDLKSGKFVYETPKLGTEFYETLQPVISKDSNILVHQSSFRPFEFKVISLRNSKFETIFSSEGIDLMDSTKQKVKGVQISPDNKKLLFRVDSRPNGPNGTYINDCVEQHFKLIDISSGDVVFSESTCTPLWFTDAQVIPNNNWDDFLIPEGKGYYLRSNKALLFPKNWHGNFFISNDSKILYINDNKRFIGITDIKSGSEIYRFSYADIFNKKRVPSYSLSDDKKTFILGNWIDERANFYKNLYFDLSDLEKF